jgi:hypothetical protein
MWFRTATDMRAYRIEKKAGGEVGFEFTSDKETKEFCGARPKELKRKEGNP